jgi:hypothetical protein
MTIRFEYISTCCAHIYVEQRAANEPLFFINCTKCEQGTYNLVKETIISEIIERVSGPETVVEEPTPEQSEE